MEAFGKFMAVILGMIVTSLIRAFTFQLLWGWIVLPIFPALLAITLGQAYALNLFRSYLTLKRDKSDKDKDQWELFIESIVWSIVMNIIVIFFGWIASMFV